jgi:hypothetical protein
MASWRFGRGFFTPTAVHSLTIDGDAWDRPPTALDVGDSGFTGRDSVPAPPRNASGEYYSDMLLSDDGAHAAVLSVAEGQHATAHIYLWDARVWTTLVPPFAIGAAQWPGTWDNGGRNAGGLSAKNELGVSTVSLVLFGAQSAEDIPARSGFASFRDGAWNTALPPSPENLAGNAFRVSSDGSAVIASWATSAGPVCGVWTGAAWSTEVSHGAEDTLGTQANLGISGDGRFAACAGIRYLPAPASTAPAAQAAVSVWEGAWQTYDLGDSRTVQGVAVANHGDLAAVSTYRGDLPAVWLYRRGVGTVAALSDSRALYPPRVAVSADGSTAVAVWVEASGLFAAYYH